VTISANLAPGRGGFGGDARVHQHVALALEIPRRQPGRALRAGHVLGQSLPLGDERAHQAPRLFARTRVAVVVCRHVE